MMIRAKGWAEFQHYRGRNPPWIKLHRRLLDDFDFQRLPVASKALAPLLWLLASETVSGVVDAHTEKLAFRLRMKVSEIEAGLKPLLNAGFFEALDPPCKQDASTPLADCLQDACPETEGEGEGDIAIARSKRAAAAFERFWDACPRKVGKGKARKAYDAAVFKTSPDLILAAMQRYAASRAGEPEQYTAHPATWLAADRWLDEGKSANGATSQAVQARAAVEAEEQENLKRMGLV